MKFHHIGLFVSDVVNGRDVICTLFPEVQFSNVIDDPGHHVTVQFCREASGILYELVAPFGEKNPVSDVLKNGKNILNHVAYGVDDIEAAFGRMRAHGCMPLGRPMPAVAFGGRKVVFMLTPLRFIIELVEKPDDFHDMGALI